MTETSTKQEMTLPKRIAIRADVFDVIDVPPDITTEADVTRFALEVASRILETAIQWESRPVDNVTFE